jgi:hypothetical protein
MLTRYLGPSRDAVLAGYGPRWWEFKALHLLRRGGSPYKATPGSWQRSSGGRRRH